MGGVVFAALSLAAAGPARAQSPAGDAACFPACRSGYLCHEGRCVSACNPLCGASETCTATGECIPAAPVAPPSPSLFVDDQPPTAAASGHEVDAGWARGAFYFGATSVALDVALTAAIVAANPAKADLARNLGGLSVVVFGVTAPLTALGGASARNQAAVTGHPRLRVASWVGYALTLGEVAWLLGRSYNKVIGDGWVVSVGVLGALSSLGFTLDARTSASQAEHLRALGVSQPTISFASGGGGLVPTWGWVGTF
jgi:hypothetical protein